MAPTTAGLLQGVAELSAILHDEYNSLTADPSHADFSGSLLKMDEIERDALKPTQTRLAELLKSLREKLSPLSSAADKELILKNLDDIMYAARAIGLEIKPDEAQGMEVTGLDGLT